MNLTHFDSYKMIPRHGDPGRLLDAFMPRFEREETAAGYDWVPAVDIKAAGNSYIIHADVPGIKPENIDVSLEDGVLTIRGERRFDGEEAKDGYRHVERVRGTFYRRFTIPDMADQERVTARCNDGVLEVVIEKQEKALPRKIAVNS